MESTARSDFLNALQARYGPLARLPGSRSMFEIGDGVARVYLRYSRLHNGVRGFYGLRKSDLQQLEGRPSVICFLWDGQAEPLLVPYGEYEDLFTDFAPASDGQYKFLVFPREDGTDLYIANRGRFNVEGHYGWDALDHLIGTSAAEASPDLTHPQLQTLLGSIGARKNYDVWIPMNDRDKLDWAQTEPFGFRSHLPDAFGEIGHILQEVDVIWLEKGSSTLKALFEVEHTTTIYSGLLRFNDFYLLSPKPQPSFTIVADETRRARFSRQVNRPTFRTSGLADTCSFLNYRDVLVWHSRLTAKPAN